jgi:hypothetical protein
MKDRKIKVNGSAPSDPPKAVGYADIKGQGRIPYGKTMATDNVRKMKTRGTGAAIRGTSYMGSGS